MPATNSTTHCHCFSIFLMLALFSTLPAQNVVENPDDDDEQALVESWYKAYDDIIDSIAVGQSDPSSKNPPDTTPVELTRTTVLSINDPAFLGRHGRLYLWTEIGRPVVVGAIMSTIDQRVGSLRRVTYEFNSLSQKPTTAGRGGVIYWNCTEPGVNWQSELVESFPSASRTARLTQMRSIAREIEANDFRLMTTPLYRYPIETPDVTDGAIFAFTRHGTDPALFLLIEARQNKWHLSFSPSNVNPINVKLGTKTVESFAYIPNRNTYQTMPFYQKNSAESRPADEPNTIFERAWNNQ